MKRDVYQVIEYTLTPDEVLRAIIHYADSNDVKFSNGKKLPVIVDNSMKVELTEDGAVIHAYKYLEKVEDD